MRLRGGAEGEREGGEREREREGRMELKAGGREGGEREQKEEGGMLMSGRKGEYERRCSAVVQLFSLV